MTHKLNEHLWADRFLDQLSKLLPTVSVADATACAADAFASNDEESPSSVET